MKLTGRRLVRRQYSFAVTPWILRLCWMHGWCHRYAHIERAYLSQVVPVILSSFPFVPTNYSQPVSTHTFSLSLRLLQDPNNPFRNVFSLRHALSPSAWRRCPGPIWWLCPNLWEYSIRARNRRLKPYPRLLLGSSMYRRRELCTGDRDLSGRLYR